MTRFHAFVLALALLGISTRSQADTIQFLSGGQMQGVVLKDYDGSLVVHLKHGLVTLSKADVSSISKDEETVLVGGRRFLPWMAALHSLLKLPWGSDLRPDPAVIIDSGTFKHIPYVCDRAGSREFSIYGDPEEPAGLEIGLSKELVQNGDARKEAIQALKSLLIDKPDQEFLSTLDVSKPSKTDRAGLTFQVELDKNAKGDETWWITVFSPSALDRMRLSEEEAKKLDSSGAGAGSTSSTPSPGTGSSSTPASTTSNTPPGTIGFSPSAMNGETPTPPRRTYNRGGHYGNYWRMHPRPKPMTQPKPQGTTK
jgi:hypothetical protein